MPSFLNSQFLFETKNLGLPDYSKIAFCFVGQGSVYPKMFKRESETIPVFKNNLVQTDKLAIKYGLVEPSLFISAANIPNVKNLHISRNLALFSSQVSKASHLMEIGLEPQFLTSHSFGEYASLVTSGAIDFETGLKAVILRDTSCAEPHEIGSMIAVATSNEVLKSTLSSEDYFLANQNSPKQIVISVAEKNLTTVIDKLKKSKIAFVILKIVPQPYHSPLMQEFADKFERQLGDINFTPKPLKYALLSSVSGKIYPKGHLFKKEELIQIMVQQLVAPVNFVHQISQLFEKNLRSYLEIGPGDTLSNFINAILLGQEINAKNGSHYVSITEQQEEHIDLGNIYKSPWLKRITEVISEVTGYKTSEIDASSRFQDDLAIDSIKKAEILFRTLKKAQLAPTGDVSIARFTRIYEVVNYLESANLDQAKKTTANYEFFRLQKKWLDSELFPLSSANVQAPKPSWFDLNEIFKNLDSFSPNFTEENEWIILDARKWNADWTNRSQVQDCFRLIQKLNFAIQGKTNISSLFLLLSLNPGPLAYGFRSGLKSFQKENRNFFFKSILLDSSENLENLLSDEYFDRSSSDVKYNPQRQIIDFKQLENISKSISFPKSVLFIGGARGINFELIKELSKKYSFHSYITGRTSSESSQVQTNLQSLSVLGINYTYLKADAASPEDMENVFNEILKKEKQIDLTICSAGIEVSKKFGLRTVEDLLEEYNSKAKPLENLVKLSEKFPLKKVYVSSSIVSHFGNDGQVGYSMANEVLDTACMHSSSKTQFRCLHWPAWKQVGMTSDLGIFQKLLEKRISMIEPRRAAELLLEDYSSSEKDSSSVLFSTKEDTFGLRYLSTENRKEYSMIQSQNEGRLFTVVLNPLKDAYLKDHRVRGKFVVPVSFCTTLFLALGKIAWMRKFRIENFQFKVPLILNEVDTEVKLALEPLKPNGYSASISTTINHAVCQLFENSGIEETIKVNKESFEEFSPDEIYDFSRGLVDLDQEIQVIERIYRDIGSMEMISEINVNVLKKLSSDSFFNNWFQLVEIGMQTTGALGVLRERRIPLPQRFGSLIWGKNPGKVAHVGVFSQATGVIPNGYVANVVFYCTETKRVLLKISDLEYEYIN